MNNSKLLYKTVMQNGRISRPGPHHPGAPVPPRRHTRSSPPYPARSEPSCPARTRTATAHHARPGLSRHARPGPGPPLFPELAGARPDLDRCAWSSLELAPDLAVPAPAPISIAPARSPCSSLLELVPDLAVSELAAPRASRIGAAPRDGVGLGRSADCASGGWTSSGENSGGGHGGELRPARGRRRDAKHF
jgi:hypothetical protein